jgi:hypothetical protein
MTGIADFRPGQDHPRQIWDLGPPKPVEPTCALPARL